MVLDNLAEYLSIDKGALIAPLSILASAIIGSSVACWAVLTNRRLAKLKNSMDFINGYNEDSDISAAMKEIRKIEGMSTSELQKLAGDGSLCQEAVHIMTVLNYYEAMALCVHRGIYDDTIIKEAVFTTVTDIWRIFQPYVTERRKLKNNLTYFQEVEKLTNSWNKKPLESKEK